MNHANNMHKYSKKHLLSLRNDSKHCYTKSVNDRIPEEIQWKPSLKRNKYRGKSNKYQLLQILNWNIEGLNNTRTESPENNIFHEADIIFLTETMCISNPKHIEGYYNVSSAAKKQDKGRPIGGISINAKPNIKISSSNITNCKIQCITNVGEIICYYFNPTTDIEDIIQQITEDIDNVKSESCIIAGDFNCRIDTVNQKGETLVELLTSKQFRLVNNPTQYTYIAHNGKSCIDLIFVKSRKQKVIKESTVILDPMKKHQKVLATIRMKTKSDTVNTYRSKESINKIHRDIDIKKIHQNSNTADLSPENKNDIKNLTKILNNAAFKKKKKRQIHKPWYDEECKILKQRSLIYMKNNIFNTESSSQHKLYKSTLQKKRLQYKEKKIIEKCKEALTKPWEMFERNFNSNTIELQQLEEHFRKLLHTTSESNTEIVDNTLTDTHNEEWYNESITLNEISDAVKSLKNKKGSGLDQVFNEHIKKSFDYFQDWWVIYLNNLLEKGEIPDAWRTAKLKTLYKGKGNLSDPNMYRGIALMSTTYKLFTKILNNRITQNLDSSLPQEQFGFRRGKNCQQAIGTLRSDIKCNLEKPKGKTYCVYVDFEKAFDSLDRKILLQSIYNAGVQGKIFNSIKNIISANFLKLDNGVETSKSIIEQNIGVIQGDPLSSTLFILYVMSLPDSIKNTEHVNTLMFADDLVIYSENIDAVQDALQNLQSWCLKYKLKVNIKKTKAMKFRNGGKLKNTDILTLNNNNLEFVNSFEYLGVIMQPTLTISKHINSKSVKASYAIGSINHMLYISLATLHRIFTIKIWPIVTYSFEVLAYNISAQHLIILDKIKARFYKKALGLNKYTSNTLTLHMVGAQRFGEEVIQIYGEKIKSEEIIKYRNMVEMKNMEFTTQKYTDGPIFKTNCWKNHGQANRHIIARYTAHGFHHRVCDRNTYHTEYDNCICNLCGAQNVHRYHLDDHISDKTSLSQLIKMLENKN